MILIREKGKYVARAEHCIYLVLCRRFFFLLLCVLGRVRGVNFLSDKTSVFTANVFLLSLFWTADNAELFTYEKQYHEYSQNLDYIWVLQAFLYSFSIPSFPFVIHELSISSMLIEMVLSI